MKTVKLELRWNQDGYLLRFPFGGTKHLIKIHPGDEMIENSEDPETTVDDPDNCGGTAIGLHTDGFISTDDPKQLTEHLKEVAGTIRFYNFLRIYGFIISEGNQERDDDWYEVEINEAFTAGVVKAYLEAEESGQETGTTYFQVEYEPSEE